MQDLARVHTAQDDSVRRGEHHSKLGVRVGIRLRQNIRSCRLESASFSPWLGGTGQLRSDLIDGIGCSVSRGHDRVVGIVVRQRRPAAGRLPLTL